MASKNVAIQRSVYDALAKEKRPGESFTQLFARLLTQQGPLGDLGELWGGSLEIDRRRFGRFRSALGVKSHP